MRTDISMTTRKELSRELAQRYQRARKKERGQILGEIIAVTGYNRCYASWLLRNWGRKHVRWQGKQRVVYVGIRGKKVVRTRNRPKKYDEEILAALQKVWLVLDCPCSKRLKDYLAEIVRKMERQGLLTLNQETREKLLSISARTMDRLLRADRRRLWGKNKGGTTPGKLLKWQVPIRTFAEWDHSQPGFLEIDLVEHNGGSCRGIYAVTLNGTDIATGWTEPLAAENKSQTHVFEALNTSLKRYPFPILGLDADSGGEFINTNLIRYCQQSHITFTRGRPYRKNDQCYIEQKNWTTVRKTVGYERYDTPEEIGLLNRMYAYLRLYSNFFQPQMKLLKKVRRGSRLTRHYDTAKTPYQRILAHPNIPGLVKKRLRRHYDRLNPLLLKQSILGLREKLRAAYFKKKRNQKQNQNDFV